MDIWKDAQCHWSSEKFILEAQWDNPSHLSEWLSLINQLLGRLQIGVAIMENSMEIPEKKWKYSLWPTTPFMSTYLNKPKTLIQKNICIPMFVALLFTLAKIWKLPRYPSVDDWIKKWYIYAMEYNLAIKNNEILPFVTAWIDLEGIIPSEVSQTEKEKYNIDFTYM